MILNEWTQRKKNLENRSLNHWGWIDINGYSRNKSVKFFKKESIKDKNTKQNSIKEVN